MSEVIILTILAVVLGAIMIAVIVALVSPTTKTVSVPVKVTPVKEKAPPEKKTGTTGYVSIYQYKNPGDRVRCRSCDTENWPQVRFCDTCGQPL